MSDTPFTNFVTGQLQIGTHNGWDLVYYPHNNSFGATKVRKQRTDANRDRLLAQCDDSDAEEQRSKRRIEPCEFTRWDPETQTEQQVRLTSFSNRGLALKPLSDGETVYLDRNRWRSQNGTQILVVKKGASTKRLHIAVEMLRRAQAELKKAEDETLEVIQVNDPGYGGRTAQFHVEEDRLRAAINKLTKS